MTLKGLKALLLVMLIALASFVPVSAAVQDITITDVTTRAFSVVWASDEPVTDASLRVFEDANGTTDISNSLGFRLVSAEFPPALDHGIVKIDVTGLSPDTDYYIQTDTSSISGTILSPATAPFINVKTAVRTRKANAANQPIINDLITHPVFAPDGVTPAEGALLLLEVEGTGTYPISAFVGEGGFSSPQAVVDLNNLFDINGLSAEISEGQIIRLTEFRGNVLCPELDKHKLFRFKKIPAHEETPIITELESPASCFFVDTVCDDQIDVIDAQFVLNALNSAPGECEYNSSLDVVQDNVIDIIDVQQVLNFFGQTVP